LTSTKIHQSIACRIRQFVGWRNWHVGSATWRPAQWGYFGSQRRRPCLREDRTTLRRFTAASPRSPARPHPEHSRRADFTALGSPL